METDPPEVQGLSTRAPGMSPPDEIDILSDALPESSTRFESARTPLVESTDVGNIAVVVDNGRLFSPGNPFDFDLTGAPVAVRFEPVGPSADGIFEVSVGPGNWYEGGPGDTVIPLALEDDGSESVSLPFDFPFFGTKYDAVFVNANGNLTFTVPDNTWPRSNAVDRKDQFLEGPPRIAPLFSDLDRTACQTSPASDPCSISYVLTEDYIVVSWTDVPLLLSDTTVPDSSRTFPDTRRTFQVRLDPASGAIEFIYDRFDVNFSGRMDLVGIAEGNYQGAVHELDFSEDLPLNLEGGAIFELFNDVRTRSLNLVEATKEFYRTHPDKFDFLMVYVTEPTAIPFGNTEFTHFNFRVRNSVLGVNNPVFNMSAGYGSAGELEAVSFMNDEEAFSYSPQGMLNPPFIALGDWGVTITPEGSEWVWKAIQEARLPGVLGRNDESLGVTPRPFTAGFIESALSRHAHEIGHGLMLANLRFRSQDPNIDPSTATNPFRTDLLGRGNFHWSFLFNVPTEYGPYSSSMMEGNRISDLGPSDDCPPEAPRKFRTHELEATDGYSLLDQYVMGMRAAGEVSPFWYVKDPQYTLSACAEIQAGDPEIPCTIGDVTRRGSRHSTRPDSTVPVKVLAPMRGAEFCGTRIDLTTQHIQYANYSGTANLLGNVLQSQKNRSGIRGFPMPPGVPLSACPGALIARDELAAGTRLCREAAGQPLLPCRPLCTIGSEIDMDSISGTHAPDVKTMAFLLVVNGDRPLYSYMGAIQHVENLRRQLMNYLHISLGARRADGSLNPNAPQKFDSNLNPRIY